MLVHDLLRRYRWSFGVDSCDASLLLKGPGVPLVPTKAYCVYRLPRPVYPFVLLGLGLLFAQRGLNSKYLIWTGGDRPLAILF